MHAEFWSEIVQSNDQLKNFSAYGEIILKQDVKLSKKLKINKDKTIILPDLFANVKYDPSIYGKSAN